MELAGKKIVFLGDSITEGYGTTAPEYIFLNRLKERAKLREVVNYGIGGTRIARQTVPTLDRPQFDRDFCMRVEELDEDADIVVVFGGTNDYGHGDAPLGSMDQRTPETFYGACHFLMRRLHERFPGKPVILMTPLHRKVEDDLTSAGHKAVPAAPLCTYVEIIKEVAAYYALPVLDLYAVSGIAPQVEAIEKRYTIDGLHPNDAGHALLADRLYAFLKAY